MSIIPGRLDMTAGATVADAGKVLGISTRRIRQLVLLHPRIVASERPLRIYIDELRQIRGGSPATVAAAALHVCESLVPKLADANRTPEVVSLLLIDQLHPELRAARCYPEPLRRLRARAGLTPDPQK